MNCAEPDCFEARFALKRHASSFILRMARDIDSNRCTEAAGRRHCGKRPRRGCSGTRQSELEHELFLTIFVLDGDGRRNTMFESGKQMCFRSSLGKLQYTRGFLVSLTEHYKK